MMMLADVNTYTIDENQFKKSNKRNVKIQHLTTSYYDFAMLICTKCRSTKCRSTKCRLLHTTTSYYLVLYFQSDF